MINIITLKFGDKFDPWHVNRLWVMVRAQYKGDFNFHCYTDDPEGIWYPEIQTHELPDPYLDGIFHKLSLLDVQHADKCIFLDLDIVLQKDITEFFNTEINEVTVLDATWKTKDLFDGSDMHNNSSIMMWHYGMGRECLEKFYDNPDLHMLTYHGIDRFMFHENVPFNYLPIDYTYSRFYGYLQYNRGNQPHPTNQAWGLHYYPDMHICIFNAWNKILDYSKGYLIDNKSYKGYESYWNYDRYTSIPPG